MRPLTPEERAEIRARHPGATEEDIQHFDELLARRLQLEQETPGSPAVEACEAELTAMRTERFPRWDQAMAAVAERLVAADDADEDGEIVVS
jgi:hypothetical protein